MNTEECKSLFDVKYADDMLIFRNEVRAIIVTLVDALSEIALDRPLSPKPEDQYADIVELAARHKMLAQATLGHIREFLTFERYDGPLN